MLIVLILYFIVAFLVFCMLYVHSKREADRLTAMSFRRVYSVDTWKIVLQSAFWPGTILIAILNNVANSK